MYNKVVLVGNLTKDIELKYLPSGSAVATSSVATSHKYKSASGEQKDEVCFLDFTIFGKTGEVANQYLEKGSKVLLEGRLKFEQWTAQNGSNRSRHILSVDTMKMLDSKDKSDNQESQTPQQKKEPRIEYEHTSLPEISIDEDEIPFAPLGLQYPYILHAM